MTTSIKTYRRKIANVEAAQITKENIQTIAGWCHGVVYHEGQPTAFIKIRTPKNVMSASLGDFIVQGIENEFYPVPGDRFFELYEAPLEGQDSQDTPQKASPKTTGYTPKAETKGEK